MASISLSGTMTEQSSTTAETRNTYSLPSQPSPSSPPSSSTIQGRQLSSASGSGLSTRPSPGPGPNPPQNEASRAQATTKGPHTIARTIASSSIYYVERNVYVGLLKELPPPPIIKEQWENGIKDELDNYLCSFVSNSGLPDRKCTLESVLCFAGSRSTHPMGILRRPLPSDKIVFLNPTVWIHCASKRCRSMVREKVEAKVDALVHLYRFLDNHGMHAPRVSRHAPWPAAELLPEFEESPTMPDSEDLEVMSFSVQDVGVPLTMKCSTRKAKVSVSGQFGIKAELHSTVGGHIRVGDVTFGLTTAHAIADYLGMDVSDDESSSDDSLSSEEECDADSDFSHPELRSMPSDQPSEERQLPLAAEVPVQKYTEECIERWVELEGPKILAYQGRGTRKGNLSLPETAPSGSDFALVNMEPLGELSNSYRDADGPVIITDFISSANLEKGKVSVLLPEQETPHEGYLLDDLSSIIVHGKLMRTRKVQIEFTPYPGISGSWVVRHNQLCGITYAAYNRSPYLHILPAESLFADISSYLDIHPINVAQGGDLKTDEGLNPAREGQEFPRVKRFKSLDEAREAFELASIGNPMKRRAHDPYRYGSKGERLAAGILPLSADKRSILLVQSYTYGWWTFPVRYWKVNDPSPQDVARDMAWEKAGIVCKITNNLGFQETGEDSFYFFEAVVESMEEEWPQSLKRDRNFFSYDEAVRALKDTPWLLVALKCSSIRR